MPTYVYLCDTNGAEVEVIHPMSEQIETWSELCEWSNEDPAGAPPDAPVHRRIFAPAVRSVTGASDLKNLGFSKLVRRDKGVYENVTASGNESRYMDFNGDQ